MPKDLKWKVEANNGIIRVFSEPTGAGMSRTEAVRAATMIARDKKMVIHLVDGEKVRQKDYTSAFTREEILARLETEVKIATAELTMARLARQKMKHALLVAKKSDDKEYKVQVQIKYDMAEERLRRARTHRRNYHALLNETKKHF